MDTEVDVKAQLHIIVHFREEKSPICTLQSVIYKLLR